MTPVVAVGNDVVDLAHPRTQGQAADEAFVRRVFAPGEQEVIASSARPDRELWSLWAAKECGFKIASKLLGAPPTFVHRAFEVAWTAVRDSGEPTDGPKFRSGIVRYRVPGGSAPDLGPFPVRVTIEGSVLHAHALGPDAAPSDLDRAEVELASLTEPEAAWAGALPELLPRFSPREADAVHSVASAAVRLAARSRLADRLGVDEGRLEIACAPGATGRRPPFVLVDGRRSGVDVSLSHDGEWIAWALWLGSID